MTDLDGRFHHVANAYIAGPALFPKLGSANPSLTALTLARRTAKAIVAQGRTVEEGFQSLFDGTLTGWQMIGSGHFAVVGSDILWRHWAALVHPRGVRRLHPAGGLALLERVR